MNAKSNKIRDSNLLTSHLKYITNKNLQQYIFFNVWFSKMTGNVFISFEIPQKNTVISCRLLMFRYKLL